MVHELWYTSAPHGLELGSSGYCVVKATRNIPVALRETLQRLSNYRAVFPPKHPAAENNPVSLTHVIVMSSGTRWHVISRLQATGTDHTGRSNFFAHHLTFGDEDIRGISLSAILANNVLEESWDGHVEELPAPRSVPTFSENTPTYDTWLTATGDAGWAGVVAERLLAGERVVIVFDIGAPTTKLISELLFLLSDRQQWNTSFSTYFYGGAASSDCQLCFVLNDSDEHRVAISQGIFLLDISKPLARAHGGELVETARNGRAPSQKSMLRGQFPVRPQSSPSVSANEFMVARSTPPPLPLQQTHGPVSGGSVAPSSRRPVNSGEQRNDVGYWMIPVGVVSGIVLACLVFVPVMLWFRNDLNSTEAQRALLASENLNLRSEKRSLELMHKQFGEEWEDERATQRRNVETMQKTIDKLRSDVDYKERQLLTAIRDAQDLAQLKSDTDRELRRLDIENRQLRKQVTDEVSKRYIAGKGDVSSPTSSLKKTPHSASILPDISERNGQGLDEYVDTKPVELSIEYADGKASPFTVAAGKNGHFNILRDKDKVGEVWFAQVTATKKWRLFFLWTTRVNRDDGDSVGLRELLSDGTLVIGFADRELQRLPLRER